MDRRSSTVNSMKTKVRHNGSFIWFLKHDDMAIAEEKNEHAHGAMD